LDLRGAGRRALSRAAVLVTLLMAGTGAAALAPAPVDVAIATALGTIVVRLDRAHAPLTTANFLRYVDRRAYDGATFYRSVPRRNRGRGRVTIAVIQGGLETKLGDAAVNRLPTIRLEPTTATGLSNTDGTIAMARDTAPNTASSEFFINIGDDTVLDGQRFRDHRGYAVFGRVVEGMDVVRAIARSHAKPDPVMTALLAPPIRIVRARRVSRSSP
jgi:peptidyl-prolyl cis-trans isomerase A (cyclophilin A)